MRVKNTPTTKPTQPVVTAVRTIAMMIVIGFFLVFVYDQTYLRIKYKAATNTKPSIDTTIAIFSSSLITNSS